MGVGYQPYYVVFILLLQRLVYVTHTSDLLRTYLKRNERTNEKLKYVMLYINHSDCSIDVMKLYSKFKFVVRDHVIQTLRHKLHYPGIQQPVRSLPKTPAHVQARILRYSSFDCWVWMGMPKSLGYMCVTVDILFRCACQA